MANITEIKTHNLSSPLSFVYGPMEPMLRLPDVAIQLLPRQRRGVWLDVFELEEAKRQIAELKTLNDNWDGYGAARIQEHTANNAMAAADQILQWSPFPADIAPNPNGTISLEWDTEFGAAHLEIGMTKYSFYMDRTGSTSLFCDGDADNMVPQLGILISSTLFPASPGTAALTTVAENVQSTRRGS